MLTKPMIIATALATLAVPALASSDNLYKSEERYEATSDRDARCAARSGSEGLNVAHLTQKLKDQGYTVREVERSHGCYELKATEANGVRVKICVDPTTAEIVSPKGRS